jgi:Tol biopolymer transport system component
MGWLWALAGVFVLLPTAASEAAPKASLSGELAFVRLTDGYWQVWRADLASGAEHQLTRSASDKRYPEWTEDGDLFFRNNNDELLRWAAGSEQEEPFRSDLWPAIDATPGPGDAGLALARLRTDVSDASAIYRIADDDALPAMLTKGPGLRMHPAWTADGSHVAFVRTRGPQRSDIRRVAFSGGKIEDVVAGKFRSLHPDYAPADDRLVFASDRTGDFEIWLRSEGDPDARLTRTAGLDTKPVWSPDGRRIAFTTYRRDRFEIWVMNADGSDAQPLVASERDTRDPAWR